MQLPKLQACTCLSLAILREQRLYAMTCPRTLQTVVTVTQWLGWLCTQKVLELSEQSQHLGSIAEWDFVAELLSVGKNSMSSIMKS